MLIDKTYFINQIEIPNLIGTGATFEAKQKEINGYIKIHEPSVCRKVFGKDLYDALIAGLAETTPEARWTTLKSYLVDTTNKISPIANYVYLKKWQAGQVLKTESGNKQILVAGLDANINLQESKQIWDEMVDLWDNFWEWFNEHSSDYPEWDGTMYLFDKWMLI